MSQLREDKHLSYDRDKNIVEVTESRKFDKLPQ